MRKLWQRDVRIKGIMQESVAVAEVVEIDVEIPAASLDVRIDYGGNEARDKRGTGFQIPGEEPQQFLGFFFDLVLLTPDEGQNVIADHFRRRSGVSRPRFGLHGHDTHLCEPESILQGLEGHYQPDDGTVGVGNDIAPPAPVLALGIDQPGVVRVYLRNE